MNMEKKKINLLMCFVIILVIFEFTTCEMNPEDKEMIYLGSSFNVSGEQVYTRNKNATKISQVYEKYEEKENNTIDVNIPIYTPKPDFIHAGSGNIKNGNLNFSVSKIEEKDLLDWNTFKLIFKQWESVTCDNVIKGTEFILKASNGAAPIGALDRQRITGTGKTITQETLMYVFVNKNCNITGKKSSGYEMGNFHYYTKNNLTLQLKKGWNIISRTETYGVNFSGSAHIDMKIINPIKNPEDYKWVIELGYNF